MRSYSGVAAGLGGTGHERDMYDEPFLRMVGVLTAMSIWQVGQVFDAVRCLGGGPRPR